MLAFKGDFSLFRSFTGVAIVISVLLHVGLFSFLLSSKDSDSMVLISVQYQEGSEGGSAAADGLATPKASQGNRSSSEANAASISQTRASQAAVGAVSGIAEPIQGESLGVRVKYPRLSRVLGEAGQVQIEILKTQRAVILQTSSGFKRLDESALVAVEEALKAGTLDQALLARDSLLVNFVFRLK
jgi:hypothetical protein